jgi:hypothetical protein
MALVEAIIEVGGRRRGIKRMKERKILHLARVREGMPASTDVGRSGEGERRRNIVWRKHKWTSHVVGLGFNSLTLDLLGYN